MMKKTGRLLILVLILAGFGEGGTAVDAAYHTERIEKVRMSWDAVPNAVMYELVITEGTSSKLKDVVTVKKDIYAAGYELDTSLLQVRKNDLYWKVRAMDINRKPLMQFTEPKPLLKAEINPDKPLITAQFDQLPFAKVYPVYSWIPVAKAHEYEVQIFRDSDDNPRTTDVLLRSYTIEGQSSFDYYDDDAYVGEGTYWWRIRAKNSMRMPLGKWSDRQYFRVKHDGVRIATLGDSITHGGGAVSTPPSYTMYDWQTYTGIPMLNIGLSGDTVENMANRFQRDVVQFSPKVLIIMGGINNIRLGDTGDTVIKGLSKLKYKCLFNRIIPVFVTVTPVNPVSMHSVSNIEVTPNWMNEQKQVNQWIKQQLYHVDITPQLTAHNGYLKGSLSVDGLHPDVDGKRIIGETIGAYLRQEFSDFLPEQK